MQNSEMVLENCLHLNSNRSQKSRIDLFQPIRHWLDGIEVQDPKLAKLFCKLIPADCPFERDITFFGHKLAHIPPLCKINPLYEQFVGLRFRSLCYLVDKCGEEVY